MTLTDAIKSFRVPLATLSVAALLGASALTGAATAKPTQQVPAAQASGKSASPLLWGAHIGRQFTGEQPPWDMQALYDFEALIGKNASIVSFGSPFAECEGNACVLNRFPTTPLENVRAHGAIPFFSWNTGTNKTQTNQPSFRLARFIEGAYDGHIREFAESAREWGHPFFLRLNWEMNGFWFPWAEGVNGNRPGQFAAAWRHIHDIFTSVGANNATWVWCPNVDFTRNLVPLNGLYPGDRYVDWTCLDGFNWGSTHNSVGWQSFNQVFHSTYRRVLKIAPSKPMIIGEVASDDRGGSKADWIKNMLNVIPEQYRRIRGIIWYEEKDQGMHWPIQSTRSSRRSFSHWIGRSIYRSNVFAGFTSVGPIQPPAG